MYGLEVFLQVVFAVCFLSCKAHCFYSYYHYYYHSYVYIFFHIYNCVCFVCALRACRLKKKAQHEANKIKLWGLNQEYGQYLLA